MPLKQGEKSSLGSTTTTDVPATPNHPTTNQLPSTTSTTSTSSFSPPPTPSFPPTTLLRTKLSQSSLYQPNSKRPTHALQRTPSILESFEPPDLYDHPLSRENSDDEGEDPVASLGCLMTRAPSYRRSRSPLPHPISQKPSRQSSATALSGRSPLTNMTIASNTTFTNNNNNNNNKDTIQTTHLTSFVDSPREIRSPLFEDHIPAAYVPGSLHHAPDSAISALIVRHGAVTLIRQLAEDLAHRDKELVLVRQRAEERERLLKKMLQEVEVSNLDIERRLATITKPKVLNSENLESLDNMIRMAMEEDALSDLEEVEPIPIEEPTVDGDGRGYGDEVGTKPRTERMEDSDSMRSERSGSSRGGWKSYLWGSGGKKKNGSVNSKRGDARKQIDPDVFKPPRETSSAMSRTQSRTSVASGQDYASTKLMRTTSNRSFAGDSNGLKSPPAETVSTKETQVDKKSDSVTSSWTLKLVANAPNSRGKNRGKQQLTARDDLQKIINKNNVKTIPVTRLRAGSASLKHKLPTPTTFSSPMGDQPAVSTPPAVNNDSNLGPVEMDTIIDRAEQPPTLLPAFTNDYRADYLTDRFGFIYDKKQKTESLKSGTSLSSIASHTRGSQRPPPIMTDRLGSSPSSSIVTPVVEESGDDDASDTPKTWKDFSKISSTQHGFQNPNNPAFIPPVSNLTLEFDRKPISPQPAVMERLSRPSISQVTNSANAKAQPNQTLSLKKSHEGLSGAESNTVKLLLGQLSDLHDTLQRDKETRWNEFLRKVRAQQRRKGENDGENPETAIGDGEVIGVATLGNDGKGGRQKWQEFKRLVYGGIPLTYRWKIWAECTGACTLRIPGYYQSLLALTPDPHTLSQIEQDIPRTLTTNIFFRLGPGPAKLRQILIAYSLRNPTIGYCQGMNLIAASLLLIMPSEEDSFYLLTALVENILPPRYFTPDLLHSRADQAVLKSFVRELLPPLHGHLTTLGVELEALTFQWFLSCFTDTLAAEPLFRVWDVLFCVDGATVLFRVALALLKCNEKELMRCATAAEVYQYLNGGMVHQGISVDGLISVAEGLGERVRRGEVERRREVAVGRELEGSGDDAQSVASGSLEVGSLKAGSVRSGKSAASGKGDESEARKTDASVTQMVIDEAADGSSVTAGVSLVEACEVGVVSAAG